jgi:hypothetical protein
VNHRHNFLGHAIPPLGSMTRRALMLSLLF